MKKVLGKVKKYRMLIVGIVVGLIIFGGGVYATTIGATNVSYSNSSSGMYSNTVQGAIDELYNDSKKNTDFIKSLAKSYANEVFIEVYPGPCKDMGRCTFESLALTSYMPQCMQNCVNSDGSNVSECTSQCYKRSCTTGNLGKLDDGCNNKCSGNTLCYDTCFSATVGDSGCVSAYKSLSS